MTSCVMVCDIYSWLGAMRNLSFLELRKGTIGNIQGYLISIIYKDSTFFFASQSFLKTTLLGIYFQYDHFNNKRIVLYCIREALKNLYTKFPVSIMALSFHLLPHRKEQHGLFLGKRESIIVELGTYGGELARIIDLIPWAPMHASSRRRS